MNAQSSMFNLTTCEDSRNVTSSQESADGVQPCVSPDGLTIDTSGQDPVPVNPSAQPGKAKGSKIPVISGRRGFGSSESAALQWSLENRLRRLMAERGSTLYRLTWKKQVTPSGRRIFALLALAHRTSDSGCTSWPTPTVDDANNVTRESGAFQSLARASQLTGWATPNTMDHLPSSNLEARKLRGGCSNLKDQAPLVGWNTPRATDGSKGGPNQSGGALPADAAMTGWPTPGAAPDAPNKNSNTVNGPPSLGEAARLSGWPTPNAGPQNDTDSTWQERRELLKAQHKNGNGFGLTLGMAVQTIGETSSGSPAQTANTGQLNPAFSLWLQGYAAEWASCAERAIRSFRKSRRSSSRQQKKA
jgi:hypothetical protein